SRFGEEIATAIPELSYVETSAGIRQVANRAHDNVRISNWTFPNNNHVMVPGPKKGDPWVDLSVWAVPIDDQRTMRFTIYSFPASQATEAKRFVAEPDHDYNPADDYEKLFHTGKIGDLSHVQVLAAQDYVAVRGQGIV